MSLSYRRGDATAPVGAGHKIVVHICNDAGKWGKGFVLALSKRWSEPEVSYRAAFAGGGSLALGDVQFVDVDTTITVANVVGQHGVARRGRSDVPIRYEAVRLGLRKVATRAAKDSASVHMPRIGTGLAGGNWAEIEPIIEETLIASGVPVTVYDFG